MLTAGMAIAGLAGLGIFVIGVLYLVTPRRIAAGFGLPSLPGRDATSWLRVKGIRDSATGVAAFALLLTAPPGTIAWVLVAFSLIPAGDAFVVLRSGGPRAIALGVHASTAAFMLLGAAALWCA